MKKRFHLLEDNNRDFVREVLFSCLGNFEGAQMPALNQLAAALVYVVRVDYPQRCPDFFKRLMSMIGEGIHIILVFLRVMEYISLEVIDPNAIDESSQHEHERAMEIKDAMRDHVMEDLIKNLYEIIQLGMKESNEYITELALSVLPGYIEWIDISLVVNDVFIPIFFEMLQWPTLQNAACHCLVGVVGKNMAPKDKFRLLRELKLMEVLNELDVSNTDEDFAEDVAGLINVTGVQLVETVLLFLPGGNNENEELPDTSEEELMMSLQQNVDMACRYGSHPHYNVTWNVINFLKNYVGFIKKRIGYTHPNVPCEPLTEAEMENVRKIFDMCVLKFQPKIEEEDTEDYDDDVMEEEETFMRFLGQLRGLFDDLVHVAPSEISNAVGFIVFEVFNNVFEAPPEKISAVMHIIRQLRVAVYNFKSRMQEEPFEQILRKFYTTDITGVNIRSISITYFNLARELVPFLEVHPELVIDVVGTFLGERGIANPSKKVRVFASSYLPHFLKGLGSRASAVLAPHLTDILDQLNTVLKPILSFSNDDTDEFEHESSLAEAIGILGRSRMSKDQCPQILSLCLDSFRIPLGEAIQLRDQFPDKSLCGAVYSRYINCISSVIKPATPKDLESVASQLSTCLGTILSAYSALPDDESVQISIFVYLHQLMGIPVNFLEAVDGFLADVMRRVHDRSFLAYQDLLIRMCNVYKVDFAPALTQIFSDFVITNFSWVQNLKERVDQLRAENDDDDVFQTISNCHVSTSHTLQAKYLNFLAAFFSNGLSPVLLTEQNIGYFTFVVENMWVIVLANVNIEDHNANKNVLRGLACLADYLRDNQANLPQETLVFFMKTSTVELFKCLTSDSFDIDKSSCLFSITEFSHVLLALSGFGDDYANFLGTHLVEAFGVPHNHAQTLVAGLQHYSQGREYGQILGRKSEAHSVLQKFVISLHTGDW